jgi:hypothetical protein
VKLDREHRTVLELLDSPSFPNPTVRILAGWTVIATEARARDLLRPLIAEGYVQAIGRPARHSLTDKGREALDA